MYYRSKYAVLGGANTTGNFCRGGKITVPLALMIYVHVPSLSELTAGVKQKKGCSTFLSLLALCEALSGNVHSENPVSLPVLLDMEEKLRL